MLLWMHYLAETELLSLKPSRRKMMPFEQWGKGENIQTEWAIERYREGGKERERERERFSLDSLSLSQMDSEHLCINQSISLTVHQRCNQVMSDLSNKKGHFNVHKTTCSRVTLAHFFFITHDYTCTRHRTINSALNMTRLVIIQLAQKKRPRGKCVERCRPVIL